MPIKKYALNDSRAALDFLIEANILSKVGIDEVPETFVSKHLELIENFNVKTKSEISSVNLQDFHEGKSIHTPNPRKRWTHKSVMILMKESKHNNPIYEIKKRSRQVVLDALSKGWNGPPFDAIELAKILKYDISPNDGIPDARTIPLGKNKFRIEYNPFQKPTRLNFSINHEIVHTFFSDCHEEIRNREEDPEKNRQLEQLCNIGAAELQLPYVIFPADANNLAEITIEKIIELAQKYRSSIESFLMAFPEATDQACGIMICTFTNDETITLDYSKSSPSLNINIPYFFTIPRESRAYYCTTPGTTQRETIKWAFMDQDYDMFYIGISPMRKERKSRIAIIMVPHHHGTDKLQNKRIQIEFGDATKPKGQGNKIIAQVVNTSAALGFGFGKSLSKNFPDIKTELKRWKQNKSEFVLGNSQLLHVTTDTYVFQILAQKGLRAKPGETLLDYASLKQGLVELREKALQLNADVYMPLIGSGQAKGKWEIIEGLIFSELVNQDVKVTIYLFGSRKPDEFRPTSTLSLFNEKSTWQKEK